MRKALSIFIVVALLSVPAVVFAVEPAHNVLNGAVDMPHLIGLKQIHPDLWIGVEGTKGVATNLFYSNFAGIEDDHNYQILAKVTFDGCIFNCPEK